MCRHRWFGSRGCFRYRIWRPEKHKWPRSDTAQRLAFSFSAPMRHTHAQELMDQSNSLVDAVAVRPVHSGITIINQWPSVTRHKLDTRLQVPSFSFYVSDDATITAISLFKNKNIWQVHLLQWTDRRSRSGRRRAGVGTQEGSRVRCVPGTSISLHPHISLPPTWWKARPWKGEDRLYSASA